VNEETKKILCPYCAEAFDDFEGMKGHVLAQHKDEDVPLPEGVISLTVNGQVYQTCVEPQWTLNDLLHDKMGLTSPKMFCDRGACGSCTVIMDGRPILSCMSLAIECDGKVIETAEGIADRGHPLIETYVKNHSMQCGYCTPGFVTTAKALLDKNPYPTEEEIVEALGGNLCRCGTYPQHPKAILEAAELLKKSERGS
jgi:aerobic-type carbon monoxide dehydrogenase small subunit (CoxS/CutS family)